MLQAIKRDKKQKEKKSEKWKTIQDEQKAKRDEKQKKRRTNLKERTGEFPSGAFLCLFVSCLTQQRSSLPASLPP